jgi:hypothetical protein
MCSTTVLQIRLQSAAAAEAQQALKAQISKLSQGLSKAQQDTDKRLQTIQNQKQKLTASLVDDLMLKEVSGVAMRTQYITVSTPVR